MDKVFWKMALSVGGVATVALFVLWSLYDRILRLKIFSVLGEVWTFVFLALLVVLIAGVAIYGIWAWKTKPANEPQASLQPPPTPPGETYVEFEIPNGFTFRRVATELAASDQSVVEFKGFEADELDAPLTAQKLKAENTRLLLARTRLLAKGHIRPYKVTKSNGIYRLTVQGDEA